MFGAGRYLCDGRLRPAGFHCKHSIFSKGIHQITLCLDLLVNGCWSITPSWDPDSTAELSWTVGCHVTVGSDEQTAWALVIESPVTAPAVTASDELLWGHE